MTPSIPGGDGLGVAIIGAGHAGYAAAAALRTGGFEGRICLASAERCLPYQRPPLSKAMLKVGDEGQWPEPQEFRSADWYRDHEIELVLGDPVAALDAARARLRFRSGRIEEFDHAVIATGSTNRRLPVPGDAPQVLGLRDVLDVAKLRARLADASRLVVIGGGFVGLELASSVRALGLDVVVVEAEDRLMRRGLSALAAEELAMRHEATGVTVMLGARVEELLHQGRHTQVHLRGGEILPADVVVVGVGAVPNTGLAEAAGLAVGDGIEVDEHLVTSSPRISAIGDVASVITPLGRARLESVQNAGDQGRYVAARLLGGAEHPPYRAVPWFWSDQAGSKVQMVGDLAGVVTDSVVVPSVKVPGGFSVWHFREDEFIAGESIDDTAGHMAMRKVLAGRTSIAVDDLRAAALHGSSAPGSI